MIDTFTNEKFDIDVKKFNFYSCGMTIQSSMHIGHARTYIFIDCLRRYFKHIGCYVSYCTNITDLDHKITNLVNKNCFDKYSNKEYDFITEHDLFVNNQRNELYDMLLKMNLLQCDYIISVRDVITDIMNTIELLLNENKAFIENGEIFLDCCKYEKVFNTKINVEKIPLWVKGKDIDITFENDIIPKGKPAWHITCSVINKKIFHDDVFLHSGGDDLIYPHHYCECIQSNFIFNKPSIFKHFIHIGALLMNGIKMTKSLNNTIELNELLKIYDIDNLKIMLLFDNYNDKIEYNDMINNYDFSKKFLNNVKKVILLQKTDFEQLRFIQLFNDAFNNLNNNFNTHEYLIDINNCLEMIIDDNVLSHMSYLRIIEMINILGISI